MPNPPTDLTITQTSGSPIIELDWDHDGISLDRFEILHRATGSSDPWTRDILAPASDFGPGPYSHQTVSAENETWVVRALEADGTVST